MKTLLLVAFLALAPAAGTVPTTGTGPWTVTIRATAWGTQQLRCCTTYYFENFATREDAAAFADTAANRGFWYEDTFVPAWRAYELRLTQ